MASTAWFVWTRILTNGRVEFVTSVKKNFAQRSNLKRVTVFGGLTLLYTPNYRRYGNFELKVIDRIFLAYSEEDA